MPIRRELIRMSEDEMWKFIETQKTIQVCTLAKDGFPHLTCLWFAVVNGEIVLETFTKSQKVKNLERDNRIAVLLEDGDSYNELRGVSIRGWAELHKDVDKVHALHMEVLRRNTEGIGEKALQAASQALAPKKTAIVIKPERIMSWDHRKLDVVY